MNIPGGISVMDLIHFRGKSRGALGAEVSPSYLNPTWQYAEDYNELCS